MEFADAEEVLGCLVDFWYDNTAYSLKLKELARDFIWAKARIEELEVELFAASTERDGLLRQKAALIAANQRLRSTT